MSKERDEMKIPKRALKEAKRRLVESGFCPNERLEKVAIITLLAPMSKLKSFGCRIIFPRQIPLQETGLEARQEAAQELFCPKCGYWSLALMLNRYPNGESRWECNKCQHRFKESEAGLEVKE